MAGRCRGWFTRSESEEVEEMANNREEWTSVIEEGSVLRGLCSQGVRIDTNTR
jgi:hypothetical protein